MLGRADRRAIGWALMLVLLAFVVLGGWLISAGNAGVAGSLGSGPSAPLGAKEVVGNSAAYPQTQPVVTYPNGVTVVYSSKNDVSPPLSSLPPAEPSKGGPPKVEEEKNFKIPINGHKDGPDPVVQDTFNPINQFSALMPAPILNFEGIGYPGVNCNCAPPDTVGDVGPNHYVQMVNSGYAVWNKSGNMVLTPRANNSIWSGFGGPCQTRNDGDPIVLYDPLADRWLLSQFTAASPYYECVAISTTGDPTGTYYRYAFQLSVNDFPDYPHLGVWPDGYYLSENIFVGGSTYGGPQAYVFDRARMLAGLPASYQTFPRLGSSFNPMLPSDLDGLTPPPAGAPNTFVEFGDPMRLYQFRVDWSNPNNSRFTNSASLDVANFIELCPFVRNCVEQPLPDRLDGMGDRPLHRLAYRNFGTHESLVLNHAVDTGSGVNHAGVRWYEVRNPRTTPVIYQQGTYAPDSASRWMGSIAMDRTGNIAIGYSLSSLNIPPSLAYAGRLASDPPGTLPQAEVILHRGQGSQLDTGNRWGDYASLVVDPSDDCTFWFTSEYYPNNNIFNWRTRIGSFRFPSCTDQPPTPTPIVSPTPTNTPTATPTPLGCGGSIPFAEGFESGTVGTFAAATTLGTIPWSATNTAAKSGTYSAFVPDPNEQSDQQLVMLDPVVIPGSAMQAELHFWHRYSFEQPDWDGGVLEYSTNGTLWLDAGPLTTQGGYTGVITATAANPLSGRSAWVGQSQSYPGFDEVKVNLISFKGGTVKFRYRMGSDLNTGAPGWWVDDVRVIVVQPCLATWTPTPTNTSTPTSTYTPTNTPTNTPTSTPTNTATATPTPDFAISVSPASQTIRPGQDATYNVTITSLHGFSGNVTLSEIGRPANSTATFQPNPVAVPEGGSATSVLKIGTKGNTAQGTYTVTINGVSGNMARSQQVTLIIRR